MARKIDVKLIMKLRHDGLSQNEIVKTRKISGLSIRQVEDIACRLNLTYSDIKDMDDNKVYRMFFPDKHSNESLYTGPDYGYVHSELKKTGVTLKLLYQEYCDHCFETGGIPVGKTKFYDGYTQYTISNDLTNHILHKPGERCEVDWSGPTMKYHDGITGDDVTVYLFVGCLPYSQYVFVEPTLNMKMDTFLQCHVDMYDFFGGVPRRTVCDNLKTGVVEHPKEGDVILTRDYEALGIHYMTAIMPAGVRKPKQKASVEGSVGKMATVIIAALRNVRFTSLEQLKTAVAKEVDKFNRSPFQKRTDGSRYEVWLEEKEDLTALPSIPFEVSHWVYGRKINLNYHIYYEKNYYSVPYQYVSKNKMVDLRITNTMLEVFMNGERIATHKLFPPYMKNKYSTHEEDMPPKFAKITEWDDERILGWAHKIGPNTEEVIRRIFNSVDIKEQGYNPSLSVLRLSNKYSDSRLETACEVALTNRIRSPRYHHLNGILSANQDKVYLERKQLQSTSDGLPKGNLRGNDYYRNGGHK